MPTTVLYPNDQTYRTVVATVQGNSTPVLWALNLRAAIQWQPSVSTWPVSVCNPSVASGFSGLVVMNGNSGLASAVNGLFGFSWSGQTTQGGQHSDDLAQAVILAPNSVLFPVPVYMFGTLTG